MSNTSEDVMYMMMHACPTKKGPQPCEKKERVATKKSGRRPISNKGF